MNFRMLDEIYSPIEKDLKAVEETLFEEIKSKEKVVDEISRYVLSPGGKLLRPALFFLSLRSLGCSDLSSDIIHTASALELIHLASLIHDDIIDKSPTRRGKDSLWKQSGLSSAMVFVDFIFSKTLKMLNSVRNYEIQEILADVVQNMCEGEIFQIHLRNSFRVNEKDHFHISMKKTAKLFSASCSLGALFSGCEKWKMRRFREFGTLFGLAFQMVDDWVDFELEDSRLGEPTLASICLERNETEDAFEIISSKLKRYLEDAKERISFLKPTPYRDSIYKLLFLLNI